MGGGRSGLPAALLCSLAFINRPTLQCCSSLERRILLPYFSSAAGFWRAGARCLELALSLHSPLLPRPHPLPHLFFLPLPPQAGGLVHGPPLPLPPRPYPLPCPPLPPQAGGLVHGLEEVVHEAEEKAKWTVEHTKGGRAGKREDGGQWASVWACRGFGGATWGEVAVP